MPILHTVGKNLFDKNKSENILDGYYIDASSKSLKTASDTITVFIENLNSVSNLVMSGNGTRNVWLFMDSNGNAISTINAISASVPNGTHSAYVYVSNGIPTNGYTVENLQIEEGSVATSYEPYKSSILSTTEDVTLRGIGEVKDTLDCLTGEVTERIGEIALNGSEEWSIRANFSNGDCKAYSITVNSLTSNIVCDRLKILPDSLKHGTEEGVFANNNLLIVKKNIATTELFKQWLSQNPITVQHKLETESVKTVDLNSSNGDVKTPVVYKNGHILLQSNSLIPELHYSIPVSYSGLIAQNTMTNLKHSWRLDELEIMAYTSIVNSQYESLILVATAETNEVVVSSEYVPDESLYNMLKVLVNANALENADEKINVFYLYGKLSDEMYMDLIMGDDMQ